jgi:hypothetical protein
MIRESESIGSYPELLFSALQPFTDPGDQKSAAAFCFAAFLVASRQLLRRRGGAGRKPSARDRRPLQKALRCAIATRAVRDRDRR